MLWMRANHPRREFARPNIRAKVGAKAAGSAKPQSGRHHDAGGAHRGRRILARLAQKKRRRLGAAFARSTGTIDAGVESRAKRGDRTTRLSADRPGPLP